MEMAFASRCSLAIDIGGSTGLLAYLFCEEPGAVIQVSKNELDHVREIFDEEHWFVGATVGNSFGRK